MDSFTNPVCTQALEDHQRKLYSPEEDLKVTDVNTGGKTLKLIQDVATRWNSTYFMFDRLWQLRSSLYSVLDNTNSSDASMKQAKSVHLSENQWDVIRTDHTSSKIIGFCKRSTLQRAVSNM